MDQPQRFGQFLLFRKSESNSYRSCYRAGSARGRAIERIIRLEIFDQPELDLDRLLSHLEPSAGLQEKLRDPHIAKGAGLGHVDGIPYAAYDFELGTSLSTFLSVARQKSFPVPFDQALFIAERIALALAAASEVEHNNGHVLHSFLTPDSVLLTNEGEVKVAGFEVAQALRDQLAGRPYCEPYLSPQCRAGQAPLNQDDVFSLGSILFELVTGQPFSIESIDLDHLIVQATSEPAPESLRLLLESSFAPRPERIPNVVTWQQSLGRLILDGECNPTTFNLAFLMHTLLRDELERGVENLEQEKKYVLPQTSAGLAPGLGSGHEASTSNQTVTRELEAASSSAFAAPGEGTRTRSHDRRPFWLGFSISGTVASALLVAFLVFGGGTEEVPASPLGASSGAGSAGGRELSQVEKTPEPSLPASSNKAEPTATVAQPAPVLLSEVVNGELDRPLDEDEVRRVVAERAQEIERSLKAEYEQQLESLRTQILDNQRRELAADGDTEPIQVPTEPGTGVDQTKATNTPVPDSTSEEAVSSTATAGSARFEPSPRTEPDAGTPPEATTIEAAFVPATAASATAPVREAGAEAAIDAEALIQPASVTRPERPEEPPSEIQSSAGASVPLQTPAQLLRLTPPTYPPAARRLGLSATARVRVLVSPKGEVKEAAIIGPRLGNGFDRAAISAVRKSRWQPATRDDEPVESWSAVTIEFRP